MTDKPKQAVIDAARRLIESSPIDDNDKPYISEVAFAEFDALVDALRELDGRA